MIWRGRPERDRLAERGFVHVASVLAPHAVARVRADLDAHARQHVTPSAYGVICHNPWRHVAAARDIIERTLAPLALELLGADELALFQDFLISKPPGASAAVKWHQDYSYWPLDGHEGLTMWIALDAADPANGCLRYIPGTHLMGERQPASFVDGAEQPPRPELAPLDAAARDHEAVDVQVAAGDMLAHHPLVWHMSPANTSDRPRHAWSLTWIADRARWAPEHAPHPYAYQLQPAAGSRVDGAWFPRFRR